MNRETPLCISSPVRRSGTTLLQRLLCSASNALVYGETCANDLNFAVNLLMNKQSMLDRSKGWYNGQLEKVLKGDVNDWIPDLMPEIDGYLQAYKNGLLSITGHYGEFAKQQNRPIWGMKMPEWNPSALTMLQNVIPGTKIIYIHRNLEDCVRSAKKIEMVINSQEVQRFCAIWKQFSDYTSIHLQGDHVLHLNYEDLLTDPDTWISKIEWFTGAKDIDRAVMQFRINTYSNDQRLEKEENYLSPADLSEEELSIVNSFSKIDESI